MSEPDGDKNFERLLASFLRDDLAPAGLGCPQPGVAAAYYEGKLSPAETRDFEQHLAACAECQGDVATLARLDSSAEVESEPIAPTEPAPRSEETPEDDSLAGETSADRAAPAQEPLLLDEVVPERDEQDDEETKPRAPEERSAEDFGPRAVMPFKPGKRRSSWTWVAPVAIAATAILAVSVAVRFAPMVEEAKRKSSESDVVMPIAPQSSVGAGGERRERNQAQLEDEKTPADRFAQAAPPARLDRATPPASQPSVDLWSAQGAAHVPTVAAPPPAPSAQSPGSRAAQLSAARPAVPEQAKKEDSARAKVLMNRAAEPALAYAAKPAPPPVRMERAAGTEPVVIIARTNLDAAWRLTGSGIERSDDGGKTWRPQMSFTSAELVTGSAPSAETCWVAGRGGVILRTSDGEHWERLISPTQDDLVQITAWNAASATVKSASGTRFSTNDGGQTWSRL